MIHVPLFYYEVCMLNNWLIASILYTINCNTFTKFTQNKFIDIKLRWINALVNLCKWLYGYKMQSCQKHFFTMFSLRVFMRLSSMLEIINVLTIHEICSSENKVQCAIIKLRIYNFTNCVTEISWFRVNVEIINFIRTRSLSRTCIINY